jgi:hypothetical protein
MHELALLVIGNADVSRTLAERLKCGKLPAENRFVEIECLAAIAIKCEVSV